MIASQFICQVIEKNQEQEAPMEYHVSAYRHLFTTSGLAPIALKQSVLGKLVKNVGHVPMLLV